MPTRSSGTFTPRDLLILAFVVSVLWPAGVHYLRNASEQSNRIRCAQNLRKIGMAIQIYANENVRTGGFPRTTFQPQPEPVVPTEYTGVNAPAPIAPGGPGPNDVTSALYLLLRTNSQYVQPADFLCPSGPADTPADPPAGSTLQSFSNFQSRASLSYGYANPYPSQAARNLGFKMNFTLASDFAIAADMGPGPTVTQVPANAPRPLMMTANSPNHRGDGQNVLYADGHVDWSATIFCGSPRPVAGSPRDNIYAFGADTSMTAPSTGHHGAPQDQFDAVILPTFEFGPQPGKIPAPGTMFMSPTGGMSGGGVAVMAGGALLILAAGAAGLFLLLRASRPGRFPPPPGIT
jgi:prepilin-type processing-associated H-X9-DG protein